MSKFSGLEWSRNPITNSHGIRLQVMHGPVTGQPRQQIDVEDYPFQFFNSHEVHVSSEVFSKENLIDNNPNTEWSSRESSVDSNEYFAIFFGERAVNFLELHPRRIRGRAYCFPEKIQINYSAGPNDWRLIKEVSLSHPESNPDPILVSLDQTVTTEALQVIGKRLRTDDFGNYFFQLGGARAGHRTLHFDAAKATTGATASPNSLFFFGDEPDLFLPADEYARAYERFVEAIKRGSATAKVSPCGFTFANSINGLSYTDYAERFYQARSAPIDEWRFHNFYFRNSYDFWETEVKRAAEWSVNHTAKMVLGSFGSPGEPQDVDMRDFHKRALTMISHESCILDACWCSYYHRDDNHNLVDANNNLTDDGRVFLDYI